MVTSWIAFGFVHNLNGPEDCRFHLTFNDEGALLSGADGGVWEHDKDALSIRKGMNTYVGRVTELLHKPPGFFSPGLREVKVYWWRGEYYHDNEGGPDSETPRGSFGLTLCSLGSSSPDSVARARVLQFFGSISTHSTPTAVAHLVVAFSSDDDEPLSLGGSRNAETKELMVLEPLSGGRRWRQWRGKWVATTQSHKFCGVAKVIDNDGIVMEECPFFTTVTECSFDE